MKGLSFDKAIEIADQYSTRHVLLGNGFSIEFFPDIFIYKRLFEQADFSLISSGVKTSFELLKTEDFERVIRCLRDSATIGKAYKIATSVSQQMRDDSDKLKELLVQTISASHPKDPSAISAAQYSACRQFIGKFKSKYTVNYDLLLYWSLMHDEDGEDLVPDDGFRTSHADIESGYESRYVVLEPNRYGQSIHFLHGALHIFDTGTEIQKFCWSRTGISLIKQIRSALEKDFFPLFIAEGTTDEKVERIRHSDYLSRASLSFRRIHNCLFIHGLSLAENDEHLLGAIEDNGNLKHLFVSLHGDVDSKKNKLIIRRAEQIGLKRPPKKPLKIDFYKAESANVWGKQ